MMLPFTLSYRSFLMAFLFSVPCWAKVWNVGPTRTYTMPSQVASLVADGDIVEIDYALYTDCASWNASNLTLKGIGQRPRIQNKVCAGKGIWNLNGINTTIENIEFSGATNPDQNGAGIRGVGGGFTVRNCYFHHNDDGILAAPVGTLAANQSSVLVEFCEFSENGFGDGQSHNIYMGNFHTFTLRYCYVHSAKVGHEVKSRALNNYILYNRIADESSDASRNLDLPNGGTSILIGNEIVQGVNSANSNIIGYGLEGLSNLAPHQLVLVNNTLVNNKSTGSFLMVQAGTALVKVINSVFAGNGTFLSGTPSILDSARNLVRTNIASVSFANPTLSDYHLTASSPALNRGLSPGTVGSYSLAPVEEYVHPAGTKDRPVNGILDLGSHEYGSSALSLFAEETAPQGTQAFPNPFEQSFTLSLTKPAQKVSLTDLYGREMSVAQPVNESIHLETGSDLPKGAYLLTVLYASGERETRRVVKK